MPAPADPSAAATCRGARGFTLLELLVVAAILSIVAGLARLATGQDDELALEQTSLVLQDTCARAQALARCARKPHGVVFDVEGDRYAIVDEEGTPARDPLTHGDAIASLAQVNQPKGVHFDDADFGAAGTSILYDGDGLPLAGGTLTLRRGSATRTLTLDLATGELLGP